MLELLPSSTDFLFLNYKTRNLIHFHISITLRAELFTVKQFSTFKSITVIQNGVYWRAIVNWLLSTVPIGGLLLTGYSEQCLLAGYCELVNQNSVYWRAIVNWLLRTVSIGGLL